MNDEAPNGHLSIGEVLSLVQQDFPDVSISKIRFLESQGLIAPERTASGYRKFYDADIDRLRWILRQQRDHFLPLKVIKKMLDQGVETADGDQSQPSLFAEPDSERPDPSPGAGDAEPTEARERSRAHPAVASSPAKAGTTVQTPTRSEQPPSEPSDESRAGRPQRQGHATPADVVAALQEGPSSPRRSGGGARANAGGEQAAGAVAPSHRRSVASAAVSANERLTRDELLDAAGIDEAQLDALEQYGLVIAVTIGHSPTYDAESLEVARLAVRYAALGVEARHLRMYKVSAEREAGFVEQLVVPLLKQRNPAARQQAIDRADELAAMGSDLHAALLRQRLGPVIGP